jgi:hypothetical protein
MLIEIHGKLNYAVLIIHYKDQFDQHTHSAIARWKV